MEKSGSESVKGSRGSSLPEPVKRYIMVELHCDMSKCDPCTYPDCPLLDETDSFKDDHKTVQLSKGPQHTVVDGKTHVTADVKRYIMVESSCDRTKCDPCTYPNCQRFVRDISLEEGTKGQNGKWMDKPKVRKVVQIDRDGTVIKNNKVIKNKEKENIS